MSEPGDYDLFELKCFHNDARKYTHELTDFEAQCFLVAANHLANYLKETYALD